MITTIQTLTQADAVIQASQKLNEALHDGHAEQKDILFLSSGGSALTLVDHLEPVNFDSRVTVGVLDERYITDPAGSNFGLLTATEFYKRVDGQGIQRIDTRVRDSETISDLAKRFNEALDVWIQQNPKGVIVVTQGIGEDGHTAGIFPSDDASKFAERFVVRKKAGNWVVGYHVDTPTKYPDRVTVRIPFLMHTKLTTSILLACGEGKDGALKSIKDTKDDIHKTPARVIHSIQNVFLFTDRPENI